MNFSEFIPVDIGHVSNEKLALVSNTFEKKSPEVWVDIAELNFIILRDAAALKSISDQVLAKVAVAQVYQLASSMGGQTVYLPKGFIRLADEKARLIVSEYRGNNHRALAQKHGVTLMRVRQILQARSAPHSSTASGPARPSTSSPELPQPSPKLTPMTNSHSALRK